MHETPDDLRALQELLDRSDAAGGRHLRDVISEERRLTAEQVCDRLQDMCLLVLATVNSKGRPFAGPVDGFFYRGAFHFGSAPDSLRFQHIRRSPWVSASHLPGEHLQVTVHGRAELIDINAPEHAGFCQTLLDYYIPRYGGEWEDMLEGAPAYARIAPERMFTFFMDEG
ncbi:MAG: pyridoxamine 5'-phosphate oxidase family protein [Actinobacteria bacterium]|nr:pyridoxamine 5'-phosphate oxidase family protein [Actinomycetota bacterium]